MSQNDKIADAGALQQSSLDAGVNAPRIITIFDPTGQPVQVPEATADLLVTRHGFRRNQINIPQAAAQLRVLFNAAHLAIEAYVSGVVSDGMIDTSDEAAKVTAHAAMEALTDAWGALEGEIARSYPVRQGEGVLLRERRVLIPVGDGTQEISLLDLTARRVLEPDNPAYGDKAITYIERQVAVDPGQVATYLATPGWSSLDS